MKISVLGLGYIGLPTAIILADAGHEVKGYDVNKDVIKSLKNGKIHIVENNLQEAYQKVFDNQKLKVYNSLPESDIYIISVPTPFKKNQLKKEADLSYILSATKEIAQILKKGDLVILESTVPPKTTRLMTDLLVKESGLGRKEFYTAHCPERVLPGNILFELKNNDRIIGAEKKESAELAKKLYDTFLDKGTNYLTDDVTAELAKLVENSYRDVNIAFANELSMICEDIGINVFELIELANKHPRVNILSPGVGVGGHCISVDPWFIIEKFPNVSTLISNARKINDNKPIIISEKIKKKLISNNINKIAILGLSYKPNIDDFRESPSITLAHILQEEGFEVVGVEPNYKGKILEKINIVEIDDLLDQNYLFVITLQHKEFLDSHFKNKLLNEKVFNCVGKN